MTEAARVTALAITRADSWKDRLITNERTGAARALLANAELALREAPEMRGVLAFSDFSLDIVSTKATPWGSKGKWTDNDNTQAAVWLQREHSIHVSSAIAAEAALTVARDRSFHPVREYLDSVKWDGTPRIDQWLSLYLGAENTEYARAVGQRWLVSAVARIYKPGSKADCCLILEGPQGIRKSTALRTIAGEAFFTDELADLGSKDAAMQTRGVWLIEIAELDSMNRSDVGRIKAFMSRSVDRFRPPYGRMLVESPRQCVFAGSVNHSAYLRDETGGRRFWPVACSRILTDELARDRDQLWAEAVVRFREGAVWWLETPELTRAAEQEQAARYEDDPWEEKLAKYVNGHDSVSVGEFLGYLGKPEGQWTRADQMRVAACFRAIGWDRYRAEIAGVRQWKYRSRKEGNRL